MDCSPPDSTVHGDSPGQNTGVGWHASSRGSSHPRDQAQVSYIAGGFFTSWATREAWCMAETNNIIKQLYPNLKKKTSKLLRNEVSAQQQADPASLKGNFLGDQNLCWGFAPLWWGYRRSEWLGWPSATASLSSELEAAICALNRKYVQTSKIFPVLRLNYVSTRTNPWNREGAWVSIPEH